MLVSLKNDFHDTCVSVQIPKDGKFSKSTSRRIDRALCGMADCSCGTIRGKQLIEIDRNDAGLWQVSKTHWRVDAANYVQEHIVWNNNYRYEWAFTAREGNTDLKK